jgi:viroplasmin and RNaseH domain-containing protein
MYIGRKTGVYTNWIDCYAQANGYEDCIVRLYDNVKEGENAWEIYRKKITSTLLKKTRIEEIISNNGGYYNAMLSNIVRKKS